MTQRVIRVTIDSSGARKGAGEVEDAVEGVDDKAEGLGTRFKGLGAILGAAISAAAIREFIELGDQFTNIGNRIRLVTDSQVEFNTVQQELIELSQRTRTGLEDTVELFSRARRATEELGLSQRETLDFTESVNQAIQVSGATAEQAANGTLQLAQALQGGVVRAEEFNSIVEQTPRLAEALADGLNVTRGELRALVVDGRLTSQQLIEALQSQAETIQGEFDQLTPTVDQGLTTVSNGLITLVGRLNEGLGATRSFGSLLQDFGNFLVDVSDNVFLFASAFQQSFVNLIAQGVAVAQNFVVRLEELGAGFITLRDVLTFDITIDEAFVRIAEEGEKARAAIEANNAAAEATIEINNELATQERLEFIERDTEALNRNTEATMTNNMETEEAAKARERAESATLKFTASLQEQIDVIELERALGDQAAGAINRLRLENQLAAIDVNTNTEAARELIETLLRLQDIQAGEQAAEAREEVLENLRTQVELLQANEEQRLRLLAIQELGLTNEDLTTEAIQAQIEEFVKLKGEIEDLEEAAQSQRDFTQELTQESARFFQTTLRDFFRGTIDDFDSVRNNFGQLLQDLAADFLASAFIDLVTNFFKDFGQNGGGGGGFGGIVGGILGLFGGKQFGGDVQAGVPIRANEGRGEVFIPSSSGQVQPIGQFANQGFGMQPPTIIIESDPERQIAAQNSAAGQATFRVQAEENIDFLKQQLGLPT